MKDSEVSSGSQSEKFSAGEGVISSFISDHGAAGLSLWNATDRLLESTVGADGSGGCHLCHENIVGEEARYYSYSVEVSSHITEARVKDEILSTTVMKYEIRYHFLVHHLRSRAVMLGPPRTESVEVVTPTKHPPDYNVTMHEAGELQVHVIFLERELAFARNALDKMYRSIANMPAAQRPKQPWKSDVKITCHRCEGKTFWRSGKGIGQCYPACPEKQAIIASGKKASVEAAWRVLFDEEDK